MVIIYVEGGGDEASLKARCRKGFSDLLQRAGFRGRMPSVKACGRRDAAFEMFQHAHSTAKNGEFVVLLVDSEAIPQGAGAWTHLKAQSGWRKPDGAVDDQAHLMVVCMETWLLADLDAIAQHFGRHFKKAKLPTADLEKRSKADVFGAINSATATAKPKGKYGKARDSFELLSRIDPTKLRAACTWARRFFDTLEKRCQDTAKSSR